MDPAESDVEDALDVIRRLVRDGEAREELAILEAMVAEGLNDVLDAD